MPWMLAAQAAAPAVGSIIGGIIGGGKSDEANARANQLAQQAMAMYNGIIPPDVKNLIVEQLKQEGLYTPETAATVDAGISKVEGIQEDASLREAQKAALSKLGQVSRTGFGPQDQAALAKVRTQIASDEQAKQAQIQQQLAARGLGGSGAELAASLASSQAGAQSASEQGNQIAADASNRALQALSAYGTAAGNVREQDFGVAKTKGSAADEFQRFNVGNQQAQTNTNVAQRNLAQQSNLSTQQRLAEANIAARREEALRQEQAKQSKFTNEMNLAHAKAGILTGQANAAMAQGKQAAEKAQGMGTGIGSAFGSILGKFGAPTPSTVTSGDLETRKQLDDTKILVPASDNAQSASDMYGRG